MSSFEERVRRKMSLVEEAKAKLREASGLEVCKICDEDLAKASQVLDGIVEEIRLGARYLELAERNSAYAGLPALAKEMQTKVAEGRSLVGEPPASAPASSQGGVLLDLLPFRPSEMLSGLREFLPSPRDTLGAVRDRGVTSNAGVRRPPLPHELLGLPLPGQMLKGVAERKAP